MIRAIVVAILICSWSIASIAQAAPQRPRTPPNLAIEGINASFNKDDILAAMSPSERRDFKQRRKELKELQENGRALPKDSPGRKIILASIREKMKDFNERYDVFRGFNGTTITLWGDPPPSKTDIIMITVMERRTGAGAGLVYPHWERRSDGAIVGSFDPPNGEVTGESYPAGPTVGGHIRIRAPRLHGSCRELGPPPPDMANPVCKCQKQGFLYGTSHLTVCNWTDAK